MVSAKIDDWKLVIGRIADDGDRAAFAMLFDHFGPRIAAYLVRLGLDLATAEEITQDVLATVWQKASLYDPAQASVSTWIYRIARNRRIDHARRARPDVVDPQSAVFADLVDPAMPADTQMATRDEQAIVARAMAELPEAQRFLVHLAFYDGLSHGDIATRTGQPLGTVKSRLRLAFSKLRRRVEEMGLSAPDA